MGTLISDLHVVTTAHCLECKQRVEAKGLRKAEHSVFVSFAKFETQPVTKFLNVLEILPRHFQFFFCEIPVPTQILIEYMITITVCRALLVVTSLYIWLEIKI